MITVPFKREHLDKLDIRYPELIGMDLDRAYEEVPKYADAGPAFSLFTEKWLLIAIFGLGIIWEGVGLGWVLPSIYVDDYKLSFHRFIKAYLRLMIEANHLHRVQCYVHVDYAVSQKWVERLGFHVEGLLEKFGQDKSDYFLYARVE